jgi:hypothetical protein
MHSRWNRRRFLFSGPAFAVAFSAGVRLPAQPQLSAYTIAIIDLSQDESRQVVVEKVPGQFLGQVDTVLLADNKTMLAAYPLGHGGPGTVLKRSRDGGLTWSGRLRTPANFLTDPHNAPSLHRLTDPQGKERLVLFVSYPRMQTSISENNGHTWTPLKPIFGDRKGHAPPKSMIKLPGKRYMTLYHDHIPEGDDEKLILLKIITEDGGLTWSLPQPLSRHPKYPGAKPCEPAAIRSPDGKQILCLARENASKYGGLWCVSDDDGETWSDLQQLPPGLHGDRHDMLYAPDGRLVIVFRDNRNPTSPTAGHYVGWVGHYDDILEGREGQYRLLLQRHYGAPFDTGYSGFELLPDETFVATNYVAHRPSEVNSIISTRFTIEDIDRLAETAKSPQKFAQAFHKEIAAAQSTRPKETDVFISGEDGVNQYRIPVLLTSVKGTLLAFCDARVDRPGDAPNNIDLVMKRSFDQGKTWEPRRVLLEVGPAAAANPCGLVDRETGRSAHTRVQGPREPRARLQGAQ